MYCALGTNSGVDVGALSPGLGPRPGAVSKHSDPRAWLLGAETLAVRTKTGTSTSSGADLLPYYVSTLVGSCAWMRIGKADA